MDRGGLSREQYEANVRALRENMREALDAKKKYEIGEESEASEEGQGERQPETSDR